MHKYLATFFTLAEDYCENKLCFILVVI